MPTEFCIDRYRTRQNFEKSAQSYDAAAVLQQEVARRLIERLDYIKIQPQLAVDLGCGTGQISAELLKRYPKSQVLALDLALNILEKARKKGSWLRKALPVCADVHQLPLKAHSVDLLMSSLMLQWCDDLPKVFNDMAYTMRSGGLLLFTTFGPDTLKELRQSWHSVDNFPHSSQYADMHDIGDELMKAGFSQPVMDMEIITMTYSSVDYLMRDLKDIGASNTDTSRRKGLTGKARMQAFKQAYKQFQQEDGLYPATYEVIYGHAWMPDQSLQKPAGVETFIPIKPI